MKIPRHNLFHSEVLSLLLTVGLLPCWCHLLALCSCPSLSRGVSPDLKTGKWGLHQSSSFYSFLVHDSLLSSEQCSIPLLLGLPVELIFIPLPSPPSVQFQHHVLGLPIWRESFFMPDEKKNNFSSFLES